MSAEKARAGMERDFGDYGCPLTNVAAFNYLGRIIMTTDNYWPKVVANVRKTRKKWVRMLRILRQEGVDASTSGNFFKSVMQ